MTDLLNLAKEKGFEEPIVHVWNEFKPGYIKSIEGGKESCLLYLLQKWLREEYDLYIEIPIEAHVEKKSFTWNIFGKRYKSKLFWCLEDSNGVSYTTYEEALEKALIEAINHI